MKLTVTFLAFVSTLLTTSLGIEGCAIAGSGISIKKPTLLILGTDISGTFSNYEKLPPQYLNEICQGIAESGGGGCVAAYPIGNPNDSAFVRCKILPKKAIDENYSTGTWRTSQIDTPTLTTKKHSTQHGFKPIKISKKGGIFFAERRLFLRCQFIFG